MTGRTGIALAVVLRVGSCAVLLWCQTDDARAEAEADQGSATGAELGNRVRVAALEQVSGEPLALDPSHFTITKAPGEVTRMPVTMQRHIYEVRAQVKVGNDVNEWSGRLRCFDLRSTDPEMPYSYSFWAPYIVALHETQEPGTGYWPGDHLRLFSLGGNEKTLVGAGRFIWWMDVSEPNGKAATLKEYLLNLHVNPPQPVPHVETALKGRFVGYGSARYRYVPVTALLGLWPFAHPTGPAHITLEDMSRNEDGDLVVRTKGIKSDKPYTLIFDGKQWRTE